MYFNLNFHGFRGLISQHIAHMKARSALIGITGHSTATCLSFKIVVPRISKLATSKVGHSEHHTASTGGMSLVLEGFRTSIPQNRPHTPPGVFGGYQGWSGSNLARKMFFRKFSTLSNPSLKINRSHICTRLRANLYLPGHLELHSFFWLPLFMARFNYLHGGANWSQKFGYSA